jgi:hypothetical protein
MRTKTVAALLAALVALMILAACGGGDNGGAAADATTHTGEHEETTTEGSTTAGGGGEGGRKITVPVVDLNGSGQSGQATLTELAGGTHVLLELRGGRFGPQSADIRKGTCEQPAAQPRYRLENLSGGRGETHVQVPLDELISAEHVILLQRSTTEARSHVACGYLAAL